MATHFYLTTTLPYVNAPLHLGHALEFIRADVIARSHRLRGDAVFFNTGTDEHGQKIFTSAAAAGKDPQAFVDEAFATFVAQLASFGMTDEVHFVRTTDPHHSTAAQVFWKRVQENGYIYKKTYQTKYCIGCESEKTDSELVDGKCPLHPTLVLERIDEENYFFKFSAFQDKLLQFYERNPQFIVPEFRFNEMKAFVARGLEDFSISRLREKMPWGIPVPGDEAQVMYVWFDALTNYISTLGWPEDTQMFEQYWTHGTPTQYCGKDNTRFQGVMWQAMLMAAGLPNSARIVVNGFITGEGGVRMSKSLGNVVDPLTIAETYGTDALRYFLLKEISSFEDSPFTLERFRDAYNAGLANGLGNLTSRILTLSEQHLSPGTPFVSIGPDVADAVAHYDLQRSMQCIWQEVAALDRYIQDTEPFKVVKVDKAAGEKLISECVARLGMIATALQPFLPNTAAQILAHIAENKKPSVPLFARLV